MLLQELVPRGGDIIVQLGNDGGIGEVRLGNWNDFIYEGAWKEPYNSQPEKNQGYITYTPVSSTTSFEENAFSQWQILLDGEIVVDFIRWVVHPDIYMRFATANQRDVTYKNQYIGTIEIVRTDASLPELRLYNGAYKTGEMPFGGSSNGVNALTLLLNDEAETPQEVSLFDSIEQAFNPHAKIGYRAHFANITNFAQGMRVGPATKPFGGPFLINFWDPFLTRVKDNRKVKATDYDDGIGQVVFSDTEKILDTDLIDFNSDGKQDLPDYL